MPDMPMPGMPTPGGPPPGFPPPPGMGAGPGAPPPHATGPVSVGGAQMGTHADGMAKVKTAVQTLQDALPGIPMGSELHREVMKAISGITKNMTAEPQGGDVMQQLAALARQAQADPQRQAAMRQMMPPGIAGAPTGGAPPSPPPGM